MDFYETGNYAQAHKKFTELLKEYQKLGDKKGIASTLRIMGENYRAMGEFKMAHQKLSEALKVAAEAGDSVLIGRIFNRISAVYYEENNVIEAEKAARKSLDIARRQNDKDFIPNNFNLLGAIQRENRDYDGAIETFGQAIEFFRANGDTSDLPNVLNNIASTYLQMQKPDEAIQVAQRAFDIADKMGIKVYLLFANQVIVDAYAQKGDYKSAYEHLQSGNALNKELYNENTSRQIKEINMKFEMEKKNQEYENLQLRLRSQTLLMIAIAITLLLAIALLWMAYRRRAQMREVTRQIEETNKRLESTNQMKDRLFSIIAHDLRSPLNSIQGILSLVKTGNLSGTELSSITNSLVDRVEYTTSLLENLLTWSRSQLHGFKVNTTEVDLQKLGNTVIRQLEPAADKKKIKIINQIQAPVFAWADANMVEIVFRNLLSNAIKFTPIGGEVRIWSQILNGMPTVTVADSGIGIKPENLGKLLGGESFSTQGTANEKGSGLGLVLCKDFIQKNGGKLTAASTLGSGSKFSFSLPVKN